MNDALFGRYVPGTTIIHTCDARIKLILAFVAIVVAFLLPSFAGLGCYALVVIALYAIARIPVLHALKSLAPVMLLVLLTVLLNIFFTAGDNVLLSWAFITITQEGLVAALYMGVRLTLLLSAVSLLTLTTDTLEVIAGTDKLLTPLAKVGVPTHEMALMAGIALSFLPVFVDEYRTIRKAQMSRGVYLPCAKRGKITVFVALLVPLFVGVFRHAETLSEAFEARCYQGAANRTSLADAPNR